MSSIDYTLASNLALDVYRDVNGPTGTNTEYQNVVEIGDGNWDRLKIGGNDYDASTALQQYKDQGYTLPDSEDYEGFAYVNSVTKEVIIAHRGTDKKLSDFEDGAAQVLLDDISSQGRTALLYSQAVRDIIANDPAYSGYNVVASVGDSLGGALAQIDAAFHGNDAITYNPIPIKDVLSDQQFINGFAETTISGTGQYGPENLKLYPEIQATGNAVIDGSNIVNRVNPYDALSVQLVLTGYTFQNIHYFT